MPARSPLLPIVATVLVVLCCTACGRRGSLQPPDAGLQAKGAAATGAPATARGLPQSVGLGGGTAGAPDPEAVRDGDEVAQAATPAVGDAVPLQTTRGAKRGYVIPKQSFFLDPIL